jgi:ureidoglycolate lyase
VRLAAVSGVLIKVVFAMMRISERPVGLTRRSETGEAHMQLIADPLTPEAFAAFGDVLRAPPEPGRNYYNNALGNGRAMARPNLSVVLVNPLPSLPLSVRRMERHEFSSQSFIPLDVGRWLVVVAPHAQSGGPDAEKARAFLAGPDQGITYGMNVWHHPLTILDRPARFAVFMWLEGSKTDEEFVALAKPLTVTVSA